MDSTDSHSCGCEVEAHPSCSQAKSPPLGRASIKLLRCVIMRHLVFILSLGSSASGNTIIHDFHSLPAISETFLCFAFCWSLSCQQPHQRDEVVYLLHYPRRHGKCCLERVVTERAAQSLSAIQDESIFLFFCLPSVFLLSFFSSSCSFLTFVKATPASQGPFVNVSAMMSWFKSSGESGNPTMCLK